MSENLPQSLQDLLPKWAHFCLYTERFITRDLQIDLQDKHIIVGFSGGVDSTALLCVLYYLSFRNNMRLTAVHVDHCLRPESQADALWVEELCVLLNIKCIIRRYEIKDIARDRGIGIEEAGRHIRYELFEDVRSEHEADLIAVGHHQDDLSEDVIMRFIRGTGWPALAGMQGYLPERYLIRPFLMLPKSTLIAFVTYLNIQWREDKTNHELDGTRNRIRHEILPLIKCENPNFQESISRLWKLGAIDASYWETLSKPDDQNLLTDEELESCHKAVRLRKYKGCLDLIGPGQALAHTLFLLDEAWLSKKVGSVFQFPGDKTATISRSGIVFGFKH